MTDRGRCYSSVKPLSSLAFNEIQGRSTCEEECAYCCEQRDTKCVGARHVVWEIVRECEA